MNLVPSLETNMVLKLRYGGRVVDRSDAKGMT